MICFVFFDELLLISINPQLLALLYWLEFLHQMYTEVTEVTAVCVSAIYFASVEKS